MKKFKVPMELNSSEFYKEDNPGHEGVHYDGNQHNGRHGSPSFSKPAGGNNVLDFGGINYDNTQIKFGSVEMSMDDDMSWEKKNGVLHDPTKKFTDIHNGFEAQEVDLGKHIKCVGMPDESIGGNSSDCGYGE